MKKGSLIILILLLISAILVCGKMYIHKKKPINYYYTNLLAKNLTLSKKYEIQVLDTNFYKSKVLSKDDTDTIQYFLKDLRKPNFIQKPVSLNKKPEYKIFFKFLDTNKQFVINVYSKDVISIYPWDGDFSMDYITMNEIPLRHNIYSLCKYVFIKHPEI